MRFILWVHLLVWNLTAIEPKPKTEWKCSKLLYLLRFSSFELRIFSKCTPLWMDTKCLMFNACNTIFVDKFAVVQHFHFRFSLLVFQSFYLCDSISKLWKNVPFVIAFNETNWSNETLYWMNTTTTKGEKKLQLLSFLPLTALTCTTELLWLFPISFEFQTFFCLKLSK